MIKLYCNRCGKLRRTKVFCYKSKDREIITNLCFDCWYAFIQKLLITTHRVPVTTEEFLWILEDHNAQKF